MTRHNNANVDKVEIETLSILDRLPVLPRYEKEVLGLLAEEGDYARLLRVSGPGLRQFDVHGVVQELKGQRRRWALVKDTDYPDFCRIKGAPSLSLEGRYSSPASAFDALEKFLSDGAKAEQVK